MGLISRILGYRLDVDVEFQGWILMFATMTVVFGFCLPCYCAGLSWPPARRFAQWLQMRLPAFYAFMLVFNGMVMFLIITWLPDWGYSDYIKVCLTFVAYLASHVMKFMDSIVLIIGFIFVVAFKDRIALLFGLDHKQLFRFKVRDCLTCWSASRFRAIQLEIYKLEDLPAGDILNANNVFLEMWLGYNEGMKTRVHMNAGSSCIMKETMQLNYDDEDEDDNLHIFVKSQKMVGDAALARLDLTHKDVKELEEASAKKVQAGGQTTTSMWKETDFECIGLNPRGNIWLRIGPVDEEAGIREEA
eukprot:CAMPEP_0117580046 /NCGR_PEP_ID=MMETSP0784-20121206/64969_1 /TAXON_ID=39447 /ORGANISM="" /LENGTH=302 /DNA_ID=CAMNT_0005380033 /DNA_START=36 /DNA_END=945 /DNA_ORIENTATION=+